jgi:nicotinate-nucleotide pyrophosphorylase (carboxylating)
VHVECERVDQVQEAISAGADAVLLDNMSPDELVVCVAAARETEAATGHHTLLEASGGVTLENVRSIAGTGVDLISSGALTASAPNLDIGLDIKLERA